MGKPKPCQTVRRPKHLKNVAKAKTLSNSDDAYQDHLQAIWRPQEEVEISKISQEVVRTDNMSHERDITGNPWLDDVLGSFQVKEESNDNLEVNDEDGLIIPNIKIKKRKRNNENNIELKDSNPYLQSSLSSKDVQASSYQIETICRLCGIKLQKEELMQTKNNVFSSNYPKKILKCTSLKIKQGDGLPQKICIECIANLNRAYDFRNICIHTYKFLKHSTSTCSNSLDSNFAYSEIQPPEEGQLETMNKEINESDHAKGIQTKLHLSTKRKDQEERTKIKNKTGVRSSNYLIDRDTLSQYSDDNTDTFFDRDSIEGDVEYGCDVIIKTDVDEDARFILTDYVQYQRSSAEQYKETEGAKRIFDLSYPNRKVKYVERAKKDIAKYFQKGGTDVLCPFCPAIFNLELYTELQLHLDSHLLSTDIFVCRYEDCNETFKSPVVRKVHEGTDHGRQQLEGRVLFCDHCAETVKPATYSKSHRCKKERTDTVFQCERCPFRSRDKLRLSYHIKGFHESQQVSCKLCNAMLPLNKLRYHMNNEHRAKIPCAYCNKEFLPRNIKGHLRTHTGEKPFSCTDCGLEFTFRVSLKTHRKRYHGDDMFEVKTEV